MCICEVSPRCYGPSCRRLISSQPFHNLLITTSDSNEPGDARSMLLFPEGLAIPSPFDSIRSTRQTNSMDLSSAIEQAAEDLIRSRLLPVKLSARAKELTPKEQQETFTRWRGLSGDISSELHEQHMPTIFICGHGGRDQRCGITGPILKEQFNQIMASSFKTTELFDQWTTELISHIGGHKFAGNVIIYLPRPSVAGWERHPLAGMGVWYGRVEPKHVEGIVKETILRGRIIKEHFRGGIDGRGGILRLANVETVVSSLDV